MTPRVSDVLKLLYPNSLDWVHDEDLERGSRLHEQMESFFLSMQFEFDYSLPDSLPIEDQVRLSALQAWCLNQQLKPVAIECRFAHPQGFIGHPDFDGGWGRREYTLDWKFAETITEQNEIQGEVYRQMTGHSVALVQCNRDAKITARKLKPRPDLWATFLSGLNVWKFQHRGHAVLSEQEMQRTAQTLMEDLCQTEN